MIFSGVAWSSPSTSLSPTQKLEKYANSIYYPTDYKLHDIYFEVERSGLAKQLSETERYGKIDDLIFKVFWLIDLDKNVSKVEIVIEGLPNGFRELKENLIIMVSGQLGFVVPRKFGEDLLKYQLSYYPDSENVIQGIDESGKLSMNKFLARFDRNILKSITAYVPVGTQDTEFFVSKHPWSHDKYVTNGIEIKSVEGTQTITFISKIKYITVDGHGVPSYVSLETKSSLHTVKENAGGERNFQQKEIFNFSNYQLNRNRAKEYFSKLEKNQKAMNDSNR